MFELLEGKARQVARFNSTKVVKTAHAGVVQLAETLKPPYSPSRIRSASVAPKPDLASQQHEMYKLKNANDFVVSTSKEAPPPKKIGFLI